MRWPIIISILAIFFASGCSSSQNSNPNAPTIPAERVPTAVGTHQFWGLWQFTADPDAGRLEVAPVRTGQMHLNALFFLEPPPLVNLTLESLVIAGNKVDANIGLRHPFLGLNEFTGFDVCGILITNGSVTGFHDTDLRMTGEGDTMLLNPDGYTRWWNPAEFPVNNGTMFSYKDGLLGTKDSVADYNCTLNGYKLFCDELADPSAPVSSMSPTSRCVFSAGQKNVRHYTIDLGTSGLIFNYAVDANWQFPSGSPPWDVPDDFGPNANRPEAWNIEITEVNNTLYNDGSATGGELTLQVDVWDHFNASLDTVWADSPGNFAYTVSDTASGGGEGYSTYMVEIADATPSPGSIDILIGVECEQVDYQGLGPKGPITTYFTTSASVSGSSPGCGTGIHETLQYEGNYQLNWEQALNPSWHRTYDIASMLDGRILMQGFYNGQPALMAFDVTQNGLVNGDVIYPNLCSTDTPQWVMSMDVCDITGNIILVLYSNSAKMIAFDSKGNHITSIAASHDVYAAVDTDGDGGIWTVEYILNSDPTPMGIQAFLEHYEWTGSAYVHNPSHSLEITSDLELNPIKVCEIGIVFGSKRLILIEHSSYPWKGNMYNYDLSGGKPVLMPELTQHNFLSTPLSESQLGHWRKAFDIEIDHSDPAQEECRIMLARRSGSGWTDGSYFTKYDIDMNLLAEYHVQGTPTQDHLLESFALCKNPDDPDGIYLTIQEGWLSEPDMDAFEVYAMPADW